MRDFKKGCIRPFPLRILGSAKDHFNLEFCYRKGIEPEYPRKWPKSKKRKRGDVKPKEDDPKLELLSRPKEEDVVQGKSEPKVDESLSKLKQLEAKKEQNLKHPPYTTKGKESSFGG